MKAGAEPGNNGKVEQSMRDARPTTNPFSGPETRSLVPGLPSPGPVRTSAYTSVDVLPRFELWDRMKDRRVPITFEIEVTARCNNDCRHCYINLPADDLNARARELSPGEIEDIAREAASMGAMWCLLTGGEPLLREDFSEIYLRLKRLGLLVSVFTNACLVQMEHVELFQKYPPRDIEVTMYGATEATYERVTRRPGSFQAFVRGLDRLLSGGVKVRLKAMALRSNVHELQELARFCRARTRDYYRFDPLLHLRFDGDAVRNAEILAERLAPDEIVEVESADEERLGALKKGCDKFILTRSPCHEGSYLFLCGAGRGSFTVSYDGRFRLCSSLWHPDTVYDLRRGTLHDAWHHHVPRIRDLRSSRKELLERCGVCHVANLCLCCPAHAYLESGEMDMVVDYFCRVAHGRAKALGYQEG